MNTLFTPTQIKVSVAVRYLDEQSDANAERYVFAYTITISNLSELTVQLMSRHWVITDADMKVQEVRGDGVVGEQPVLKPRQSFEYTSGTALTTPVGTMSGSYFMQTSDGASFEVPIPLFVLSIPRVLH